MVDYSLYELGRQLDRHTGLNNENFDQPIADKLESLEDFRHLYYYFNDQKLVETLPITREKLNRLIVAELESDTNTRYLFGRLSTIRIWVTGNTLDKLTDWWLGEEESRQYDLFALNHMGPFGVDRELAALEKALVIYKGMRSSAVISEIEKIFFNLRPQHTEYGCELIYNATPAVSSLLLKKENLPEAYILKGIKSLSKLSQQKKVVVKIDFNMLEKLGSRGRLDAMKQLLGMNTPYYSWLIIMEENAKTPGYQGPSSWEEHRAEWLRKRTPEIVLPFTTTPTREQIDRFLFPCSFKFNDEVSRVSKRFDELILKECADKLDQTVKENF